MISVIQKLEVVSKISQLIQIQFCCDDIALF